ncbi:MAG TPA: hypothetical protein DDY31_17720 [Lachnospiraceae bacterium]|nr:hypothetical protein [Lachnospiraceae bacterium]
MNNKCSMYVVFGGKKAKIPVNPEEIKIDYPTDHQTYDILGTGQIVVPKKPALKTVAWEGFFPGDRNASYVNSGARSPKYYVDCFEKALKNKQVCRLVISRSSLYDTNMKCIVSSFETTDKGGEPDDIYYSVELQEYKSYAPKTVAVITTPTLTGASAEASAEAPRPVDTPVMRVGAAVIANGEYCYDSYGGRPHGTANNLTATVTRIVSGNPYPIHIGHYGWVQEAQLQITG